MLSRISLRDTQNADGSHYTLSASVEPNGVLSLQGIDSGPLVSKMFHCEDYEYNRHIDAEWVPTVLLHLLKERFSSDSDFAEWLTKYGVPSRFGTWMWGLGIT